METNQMMIDNIKKVLENNVILFVGSPLSGKGTQGNLLSQTLECSYVSTGDLFREEVKSGSDIGQQFQKYMDNGELIPNELTRKFLIKKLNDPIYNNGMILDGYPRNLSHIELFENILMNSNRNLYAVIYLNLSKSILDQRRKQRNRNDDDQNVFQRRYNIFLEETLPLIHLFESKDLLINIESNSQSPEQIHLQILEQIFKFQEKT